MFGKRSVKTEALMSKARSRIVKTNKRDPHVAIVCAAKMGRGLRLSAEEVAYLSTDDAIRERAQTVLLGEAGDALNA